MNDLLEQTVALHPEADLSDDALLYAGSAVWSDWRNHVPLAVRVVWKELDDTARAVAFLTAHSVTFYKERSEPVHDGAE